MYRIKLLVYFYLLLCFVIGMILQRQFLATGKYIFLYFILGLRLATVAIKINICQRSKCQSPSQNKIVQQITMTIGISELQRSCGRDL